jgi:hypothetical protein
VSRTVYRDIDLKKPQNFKNIKVRASGLDGWEIQGNKTGPNTFTVSVNLNANGIVLSKETIDISKSPIVSHFGFPQGFPVCEINFYADDTVCYDCFHKKGEDRHYMDFIYVAEPIDLSKYDPDDEQKNWFWQYRNPKHYDLNFTKPGWYKIVQNNEPMDNNSVYATANNMYLSTQLE